MSEVPRKDNPKHFCDLGFEADKCTFIEGHIRISAALNFFSILVGETIKLSANCHLSAAAGPATRVALSPTCLCSL